MKIERSAVGMLNVVETDGNLSLRFEENGAAFQMMASISEDGIRAEGYDVRQYANARVIVVIETEGLPDFAQRV